jgi:hypothetical protein
MLPKLSVSKLKGSQDQKASQLFKKFKNGSLLKKNRFSLHHQAGLPTLIKI